MDLELLSVNIGQPKEIGIEKDGVPLLSAIRKTPVTDAQTVEVTKNGIVGDHQVNRQHHGGAYKALYMFFVADYSYYAAALKKPFMIGELFGENLTISSHRATSSTIRIGSTYAIGDVLLRVSKVRQPCSTLGAIHPRTGIIKLMRESGLCGCYLQVLEPGTMPVSGQLRMMHVPPDSPTVQQAFFDKIRAKSNK